MAKIPQRKFITKILQNPFLPYPKLDENFTGRDTLIAGVITALSLETKEPTHHPIRFPFVCLHGLEGHGKTKAAQKIASVCIEDKIFTDIVWVSADNPAGVEDKIRNELDRLRCKGFEEVEGILLANKFYDLLKLMNLRKFLLIFDNIVGYNELEKYFPLNRDVKNIAVLATSIEKIIVPAAVGIIDNFKVNIFEESEAFKVASKILQGDDEKHEISLLITESGRIPLLLCMMSATISSFRIFQKMLNLESYPYTIHQYLQEMKGKSENPVDNLNLYPFNTKLNTCVKIARDKLRESCSLYTPITLHLLERCVYFGTDFPFNYLRKHVTTIKTDIQDILDQPFDPYTYPIELFKNAIRLLARFLLLDIKPTTSPNRYIFGIDVKVHSLIGGALRSLQVEENQEHDILEDLIGCKDYPESEFNDGDRVQFSDEASVHSKSVATLWSHAAKYEDLTRLVAFTLMSPSYTYVCVRSQNFINRPFHP
ncbi:hypothetical protein Fcan01_23864 [Folsomia candida]|uniref:NB-ARC domain-containing protein n=1 Tax=Folsomia candida TaxID=158441 RepID=A0A226DA08_FOLCA|nr:hypothetical protein Fcan01_23864 [Folsomia candida]